MSGPQVSERQLELSPGLSALVSIDFGAETSPVVEADFTTDHTEFTDKSEVKDLASFKSPSAPHFPRICPRFESNPSRDFIRDIRAIRGSKCDLFFRVSYCSQLISFRLAKIFMRVLAEVRSGVAERCGAEKYRTETDVLLRFIFLLSIFLPPVCLRE